MLVRQQTARPFSPGDSARPGPAASEEPQRSAGDAGAAAREGPALAAGRAPRPPWRLRSPPPRAGPPHRAHLGDAGTHEAAADDRDMFDEQLLGGRRGGVGGGGAHEVAGGEGHGEGAQRAAGPGRVGRGRARAALRPGGRRPGLAAPNQLLAEEGGALAPTPSLPLIP